MWSLLHFQHLFRHTDSTGLLTVECYEEVCLQGIERLRHRRIFPLLLDHHAPSLPPLRLNETGSRSLQFNGMRETRSKNVISKASPTSTLSLLPYFDTAKLFFLSINKKAFVNPFAIICTSADPLFHFIPSLTLIHYLLFHSTFTSIPTLLLLLTLCHFDPPSLQ